MFCDLVDHEMFKRLADKVQRLEDEVGKIKTDLQGEKERNEELRNKNENLLKEVNKKDVEIDQMAVELSDLKNKFKDMCVEVDNQQQQINAGKTNEQIIQQANNIVEKSKEFEETVDTVCTVKDEVKSTYAQILQEKNEIKAKQNDGNMNIKKEVKEIIRKNPRLIRETADMNKTIMIIGKKEEENKNRIDRDKTELRNIMEIMKKISEDITDRDIEVYHRVGKYEEGKHRPIKVTFNSANTAEEVLWNAQNLKDDEEMKNIWIRRFLSKEDRETVKEKIAEAKSKNEARSEEQKKVFFFKVVGLQVRKWYIDKRAMETE